MTPVSNYSAVSLTPGKHLNETKPTITGVVDTGEEFFAGVVDTGTAYFAGVVDTGEAPK